jgi:hypothetical protein
MVCILYNAYISVTISINYNIYCNYFHNISQKLQQVSVIMFILIYANFIDAYI